MADGSAQSKPYITEKPDCTIVGFFANAFIKFRALLFFNSHFLLPRETFTAVSIILLYAKVKVFAELFSKSDP